MAAEPLIAVFVDFENLALGVRDMDGGRFQIDMVLKRLLEKGRIVYKRAYCDWSRYRKEVKEFHAHGVEMVDIPQTRQSGKNSADIRMVVDAIDLCYAKHHIDVFALLTGDSDFSPLVGKLKENDKRVLGCGVKNSTSDLLVASCDEFIYYDDLVRARKATVARRRKTAASKDTPKGESDRRGNGLDEIVEIVRSLEGDYDVVWGSMVKQTINRVHPGFNPSYHGFKSFTEMLEAAGNDGLIALELDEARGNYKVRVRGE